MPVSPCLKVPLCDFVIVRSGIAILVTVGSFGGEPTVSGSLVSNELKLPPGPGEIVPLVLTEAAVGVLLIVAEYLIVTVLPAGRVKPVTPPTFAVSPDIGVMKLVLATAGLACLRLERACANLTCSPEVAALIESAEIPLWPMTLAFATSNALLTIVALLSLLGMPDIAATARLLS